MSQVPLVRSRENVVRCSRRQIGSSRQSFKLEIAGSYPVGSTRSCGSSGVEWSPNSIITCGGGPPQTVMETGPGRRFESCPQVQVVSWFGGIVAQGNVVFENNGPYA